MIFGSGPIAIFSDFCLLLPYVFAQIFGVSRESLESRRSLLIQDRRMIP